jgi:hypothetical protein
MHWQAVRTAYYAKQVQDKPQFLDVGYAPQVELLRSAQSLRSFVEELTYGYRFGVTLGHEFEEDWTSPVPPLAGTRKEVDDIMFGRGKLDANFRRWLELTMGLALTPDYVDRSPRTLQELRRTMDDTGPGATELCYSIQTYTREQLELARLICLVLVVVVGLIFLLDYILVLMPVANKLQLDSKATVHILMLIPPKIVQTIPAIHDYVTYGSINWNAPHVTTTKPQQEG